ncbi:MAG: divalent-cation tolerance protein CutA [Fidelibacterota bacterium]|nr:MAG: divalent-cation tolerance protein CutA [Candidatus Neomarinimicrobiota bacterium]
MNSESEIIKIILTTHDDLLRAQELASCLVEGRIAACVNLIPNVTSFFHWDNAVQMENEILLMIKTTEEKVPEVQALLEERHSYEVPEIIELDASVLNKPYSDWIRDCLLNAG